MAENGKPQAPEFGLFFEELQRHLVRSRTFTAALKRVGETMIQTLEAEEQIIKDLSKSLEEILQKGNRP